MSLKTKCVQCTCKVKLLIHHLSDDYSDTVKSDVCSDVYIYLGQLAGEGSKVTHHLKLNVYLQLN